MRLWVLFFVTAGSGKKVMQDAKKNRFCTALCRFSDELAGTQNVHTELYTRHGAFDNPLARNLFGLTATAQPNPGLSETLSFHVKAGANLVCYSETAGQGPLFKFPGIGWH